VAAAGDVNGDGFADVITGGPSYPPGGKFTVYYGNNRWHGEDSLERIARQARIDDTAPIDILGRSDSNTGFRLKALGRTAAGRGDVRLQWEVKPLGTPFDFIGLGTGAALNTGTPTSIGSAVPLSELVSGLAPQTLHHWRVRILSDSPFFPHTPWLKLPYNAVTESDVRTGPTTGAVSASATAPTRLLLNGGTPNPFQGTTEIGYQLPARGHLNLSVFDVMGRVVAVLADEMSEAGPHVAHWDGRGTDGQRLPAGVYLARLEFANHIEARKLVLAP
jgi:hypothetical protein